jgi:hypothetical protein
MKVALVIVGIVLALDAAATTLLILAWASRGHMPDFVTPSVFGVWGVASLALKTVGSLLAAALLWRLRPSGRVLGAIILANNIAFGLGAAARAGRFTGQLVATLVLNFVLLAVLALPAAGAACEPKVAPFAGRARFPGPETRKR